MTTPTCDGSAGYLLGNADPEVRRLVDQARLFEQELAWLFGGFEAWPGGAAVDIGCGPIGILPTLSHYVGPTGRVVGVDRDPVMLTHAAAECGQRGLVNVEFVQGDACSTGLASGSFDLAHVRLVLVNVADPAAVVAEAVRVVRPGGLVVLQEVDWLSWQCEPPHPAWEELRSLLHRLWASRGFDPCIGRRLPRLLTDAGVVDVRATGHAGIDGGDEPYQRLITTFAERFAPLLVDLGLVERTHLAALVGQLDRHLATPGTVAVRAMTVQAWGRIDTRP